MRVQIAGVHESEIKDRADVFEQKIAALLVETVHAVVDSLSGPLSADDLAPIQTEWAKRIEKDLLPDIKQAYLDAATGQRKRQRDALIEVLQQREAQTASAVALYSEDQERDDHGRWGSGGGIGSDPITNVSDPLVQERLQTISDKSKANGTFTKDAAWYQDAHVLVGEHANAKGVDPRIFTGMVAATSPHCSWDTSVSGRLINIGLAEKAVDTARANPGVDGHELAAAMAKPGMLRNSLANAVDIYNGVPIDEVLTSPKTRSFYNNLVDPTGTDSVTVDSQMIQAIHDDETVTKVGSAKNYAWAADQVRTFAKTTDMIPSSAQSVIWAQWRRDHP